MGDFNGDGKPDLATANYTSSNVSVLLGNGMGGFGTVTNFTAGAKPISVTVGDFNGDGKPDLAAANYSSNNVSVLLGNGMGGFGAATNFTVGTRPYSVAVGDFNGDGKPDLATANFTSSNVSVLLGGAVAAAPAVNLSVSAASGTEAGTTAITVTATAASAVSGVQTVSLAVTGTGITAGDFTLSNTTITIPNGATTGTVTFSVKDDLLNEGTETATLTISSPSAGIALGTTLTQNIAITDNDNAGTSTYGLPVTGAYRVVRNGSTIEIYNSTPVLVTSRPLGTDALVINGTSGNDSLTIDLGGGNFTVPITFNGGSQTSTPGDILTLTGGTFATGTFAFTNANDGTIDLTGNSQFSYTGLEPIETTGTTINDLILTFNGGAETITLTDAAGAAMTIDSPLSESLTFANPSSSLTINAGTGDDIVNITSVDTAFNASLTINGDANNDTVTLTPALSLASLAVTAETIKVNSGTVTTTGNQTYNGPVLLGVNTIINTTDVTFNSTLNTGVSAPVAGHTIFAYNRFGLNDNTNLGIGSQASGHPDWTFNQNSPSYSVKNLAVLVHLTAGGGGSGGSTQVFANVPEAASYTVAYELQIPNATNFNSLAIPYSVNNSGSIGVGSYDRIAYYLELTSVAFGTQYAYASMNAFTTNPALIGVPSRGPNGAFPGNINGKWQQLVSNMNVVSNWPGVVSGTGITTGNIEFWNADYLQNNSIGVPNASGSTYDFGDQPNGAGGHASMQIHNYGSAGGTPSGLTINATGSGNVTLAGVVGGSAPLSSLTVNAVNVTAGAIATTTSVVVNNSGTASNISGAISGATATLTKTGAGTLQLSGASPNTYGGVTTVSAGTLSLSGAFTNNIASSTTIDVQANAILNVNGLTSNTLVLASGQTLKGTGTVTGKTVAASGSNVAPGTSPGILNTGDVTFNSGSNFNVELNGTTVGTQYDQDNVTGAVTVNNANLVVALGYTPANGNSFVIVNNDLLDTVTVANPFRVGGVAIPEGGSFIAGGNRFVIFYNGGDGNDVVLVANSTPAVVYIDDSFTANPSQTIADADLGTTGSQPAIFGVTAFTSINAALAAVTSSGTIIVNGGTYAETVSLTGTRTMEITGPNSAQTVIIDDLTTIAGTPVVIEGSSNLTVGDGDSRTLAGVISGSGSFTKQGSGTYALTASNLYTGATNINVGTLQTKNSTSPTSPINLSNTAGGLNIADTNHVKASTFYSPDGRSPFRVSDWSGQTGTFPVGTASGSPANSMWLSNGTTGVGTWIAWDLGSAYTIASAHIWNYNETGGVGRGVKQFDLQIATSAPAEFGGGGTWTNVQVAVDWSNTSLYQAKGYSSIDTGFDYNWAAPFNARYVRFNNTRNYGTSDAYTGLSEVIFYTQGTTSNPIPDTSNVTIAGGAFLDLNGSSEAIGSLAGAGTVTSGIAGSPKLTVGSGNDSGSFSGVIQNGAGTVSLAKTGTGTQTLSGSNLYTGATAVNNGTLVINGSVTSNVTVTTPGVLNGSGTVTGNVLGNGTFSPGNSPGIMTIVGNFTPSGTVNFEVNSAWTAAGTHFDQYLVTGLVNMAGSTVTFTNTADASGPAANSVMKLIDNNGTLDLTTAATTPVNGALIAIGSRIFKLFYNGGDGNDVTLETQNTAPTAANSSVTTDEDFAYTFSATDFNFGDTDSGDVLSAVKITTIESAGDLEWFNGSSWVDVTQDQEISKADIDANGLRFIPAANANGSPYATFSFKVKDIGGPVLSVAAYTTTINVSAINDVPVAQASSVTTNEDTAKTFAVGDFLFSDVEGDSLASITISSLNLASGDTLKLSGTDVTVGQTITAANIPNMVYVPAANANGAARSTFGFTANDADSGTVAATIAINVTAVNDVSIGDASVTEGGNLQFNVSLDSPVGVDTVITYSTANGSASTADNDYTGQIGQTVTIPAGSTTAQITVQTTADTKVELDESLFVSLTSSVAGKIFLDLADVVGGGNGTGTGGAGGINPVTGAVVSSGFYGQISGSNVKNVYNLVPSSSFIDGVFIPDGGPTRGTSVPVSSTGITATGVGDSVDPSWDHIINGTPNVSNNYPISFSTTTEIRFHANKGLTFDLHAIEVANPGKGVSEFTALAAVAHTAGNGAEFTILVDGIILAQTYLQGGLSAPMSVAIDPDDRFLTLITTDAGSWGADHTLWGDPTLVLSTLSAVLGDNQGLGTILNDDSATVSIGDASVTEGGNLLFNVTLSNPVDVDTVITYSTADATAATADNDYTGQTLQTLTIPAGQTSGTITIVTTTDNKVEFDETISVQLTGVNASGRNVTTDDGSGQGMILNDDTATVSINNPSVTETNSGTTTLAFTVSLDKPVDVAVSATINTADGTTDPATTTDSDYVAITNGTVMFSAGSTTSQTVNVTINGDSRVELNEQLRLVLSALSAGGRSVQFSGATATLTGLGTILNDDAATVSIGDASVTEGGNQQFNVSLDSPVDVDAVITYSTADGSATTPDSDYTGQTLQTLTIPAGQTSGTITIITTADNKVEFDETISVQLTGVNASGRNVTIDDGSGLGTILNNDTATVSINSPSVTETNSGTTILAFTVSLDKPVDVAVSATINTADGTTNSATTADSDYVAITNGTVMFSAGSTTSQTVNVTINGDSKVELDEQLRLVLSALSASGRSVQFSGAAATLTGIGIGTIINDDTLLAGTVLQPTSVTTTMGSFSSAWVATKMIDKSGLSVGYTSNVTNFDTYIAGNPTHSHNAHQITPTNAQAWASKNVLTGTITYNLGSLSVVESMALWNRIDAGIGGFHLLADADGDFTSGAVTVLSNQTALLGRSGPQVFGFTPTTAQYFRLQALSDAHSFPFVIINEIAFEGRKLVKPTTNLYVSAATGTEAGTTAITVTATASSAVIGDQTVNLVVTGTNITAGDYTLTDGDAAPGIQIKILSGQTTGTVTFTVQDDPLVEATTETATLTISSPSSGITLGSTRSKTIAITNNDTATISISSPSVVETNSLTKTLAFTVSIDKAVDVAVSATTNSADGTTNPATTADNDYVAITNGTVMFSAGSTTSQAVNVTINGDSKVELNEQLRLVLSGLSAGGRSVRFSGAAATLTGIGTILDDDDRSIQGFKWLDANGDGVRNNGEQGMSGITVYIDLNTDGMHDAAEPSVVTGADGSYLIKTEGLAPGSYQLREVGPIGYEQTAPVSGFYEVTLAAVDVTPPSVPQLLPFGDEGIRTSNETPTDGDIVLEVIFVDFNDDRSPATDNDAEFDRLWAKISSNGEITRAMKSQGFRGNLIINVRKEWQHLPKNIGEYFRGLPDDYKVYTQDALSLLNVRPYTPNTIAVVLPDEDVAFNGFSASAHPISHLGTGIRSMLTLTPETYTESYRILLHEMGHSFGSPDLYPASSPYNHLVGGFGMMADARGATGFLGYHRFRYGWLADERTQFLNKSGTYDIDLTNISFTSGQSMIVIPDPNEYAKLWVIEIGQDILTQDNFKAGRFSDSDYLNKEGDRLIVYTVQGNPAAGLRPIQLDFRSPPPNPAAHLTTEWLDAVSYKAGQSLTSGAPFRLDVLTKTADGFQIKINLDTDLSGGVYPVVKDQVSPNGEYELFFQPEGNIGVKRNGNYFWDAISAGWFVGYFPDHATNFRFDNGVIQRINKQTGNVVDQYTVQAGAAPSAYLDVDNDGNIVVITPLRDVAPKDYNFGSAADTTPPTSQITALAPTSNSLTIPITVTGTDGGAVVSGVKEYDVYYSTGGGFVKFATVPASSPSTTFTGVANTTYWFRSLGRDHAGNEETKTTSDTSTSIGDVAPPATQVSTAVPTTSGLFTVSITGSKSSGSALAVFDVYVSIDGGAAVLVRSATGVSLGGGNYSGKIPFQGILDGTSHTYSFYSRGRDDAGNEEAAPVVADLSVTHSFAAAGLQATGIDVQNGANQRSYVRSLDVLFSTATGLSDLLAAGRVKVERFGIDATSVNPGTGSLVTGFGLTQADRSLRLDFGVGGLGGLNAAGNGFYRILIDQDGNNSFGDPGDAAFEFFRLLGDANGDGKVDNTDASFVTSQVGRSGNNLDADLDGNGVVNSLDQLFTSQQQGKKLEDLLFGWLDD